jgi:hypothetical protein
MPQADLLVSKPNLCVWGMIAQNFWKKQGYPEISSLPDHRLPGTAVIFVQKNPGRQAQGFRLFL